MNCTLEQITLAVAECQAGNNFDENFRTIFVCCYGKVLRFFQKHNLRAADCEDLTQEVFLRVYRNITHVRNPAAFMAWLWMIVRRVFFDYLAEHRLTNAMFLSLESFNEEDEQFALDVADLSLESNPQEMVLDDEFEKIYWEAVNSLPGQMRNCTWHYLQGCTYQQIADLMGLSRGAVSKHLFDARAKIKAYLKRRYGGSLPDEL